MGQVVRPWVGKCRMQGVGWHWWCHEHRLFGTYRSWRLAMGGLHAHYLEWHGSAVTPDGPLPDAVVEVYVDTARWDAAAVAEAALAEVGDPRPWFEVLAERQYEERRRRGRR